MNTVKWKVKDLEPHPDQHVVFGDLSESDFEALKDDIETNGLRQPIEITSDGLIIDGHQRKRVYEALGWNEIEVVVIDGLDDQQVRERFIQANLNRRQLDVLSKVRALKFCVEIEYARQGKQLVADRDMEFREYLALRLGGHMSGRSVGRYLQVLRLPRPIHDAVSSGSLPLTKAVKIESLSRERQEKIAERIAAGESPKSVVGPYIDSRGRRAMSPVAHYQQFLRSLDEHVGQLGEHADDIVGTAMDHADAADLLEQAAELCDKLGRFELDAAQRPKPPLPACVGIKQPE